MLSLLDNPFGSHCAELSRAGSSNWDPKCFKKHAHPCRYDDSCFQSLPLRCLAFANFCIVGSTAGESISRASIHICGRVHYNTSFLGTCWMRMVCGVLVQLLFRPKCVVDFCASETAVATDFDKTLFDSTVATSSTIQTPVGLLINVGKIQICSKSLHSTGNPSEHMTLCGWAIVADNLRFGWLQLPARFSCIVLIDFPSWFRFCRFFDHLKEQILSPGAHLQGKIGVMQK